MVNQNAAGPIFNVKLPVLMNQKPTENLPPKFIRNISGLYGKKGEKWLYDLPLLIDRVLEKWSLRIENVYSNLSFNFVASCIDLNGEKCVLKIGVPEEDSSMIYEYRALKAFDGRGAVKALRFDEQLGAMLIERAVTGRTLHEVCGEDYEKAVEIAVEVMSRLPRRPSNKNKFIDLDDWKKGLTRAAAADFYPRQIARAQMFFTELTEPFEQKVLLHGDVHFDNILSAGREPFLLIDPKGLVGEIGYEIAVFLNDLAGWTDHLPHRRQVLKIAVERFSRAFNISPENLEKWAYAFAVLSAWWMMEDFGEIQEKYILRAEIWEV